MNPPPPKPVDMIRQLIALPSVSSVQPAFDTSNEGVVERLGQWLEGLGFSVEILPVAGHPGKFNLLATLGRGPGGLVLAGHTDTVPFDADQWHSDPFRLREDSGRLYGLGTSDMKSFLALAVEACRELDPKRLKAPVMVLATADEESSMSGARDLVRIGRPEARYAVIGEPTGLRPVNAHKGILMEAVQLQGRSGHSSDPALGNSALEGMHRVIGALLNWRREIQDKHRDPRFAVPVATLNLGSIHGGDNPNRICGHCQLQFDLRPLPGMSLEQLRDAIRQQVDGAVAGTDLDVNVEHLFAGIPAYECRADSALVQAAETLTGHTAEAVAFGTEAPYLTELGAETLVLGPGDIAQAHQPDEFLSMDRLQPTVDLLRKLISQFCYRKS